MDRIAPTLRPPAFGRRDDGRWTPVTCPWTPLPGASLPYTALRLRRTFARLRHSSGARPKRQPRRAASRPPGPDPWQDARRRPPELLGAEPRRQREPARPSLSEVPSVALPPPRAGLLVRQPGRRTEPHQPIGWRRLGRIVA